MNQSIKKTESILRTHDFSANNIQHLLLVTDTEEKEMIRLAAEKTLLSFCGDTVFFRGLIEFSNVCAMDCLYCGIRKTNQTIHRYSLNKEEILHAARFCSEAGYGSLVLQSGERRDEHFISFIADVVQTIKKETSSSKLPQGLGITLCVGEQTQDTYQKFFDAGVHRYLLRIETTDPLLFSQIHPVSQTIDTRKKCLEVLKTIGFQVGTGVMIGLPGQTISMLCKDLCFFSEFDIDMVGMGPYIKHNQTPLSNKQNQFTEQESFQLTLLMIAVLRLMMKDINIAATTALQTIDPQGREKGLQHGANIIMPQLTPGQYRKDYLLYEGKPCVNEDMGDCAACLKMRIESVGRKLGLFEWGDSKHVKRK